MARRSRLKSCRATAYFPIPVKTLCGVFEEVLPVAELDTTLSTCVLLRKHEGPHVGFVLNTLRNWI